MSAFAKACRGLDCLLAIDAERGYPRWLSPLREGVALPSAPVPVFTLDHAAGTLDIDVIGDGVMRTYADGSVIEGNGRVTKTVPAGTTTIEAFGWDIPTSRLYMYSSSSLSNTTIAAKDLPRATNILYLADLPGLTGACTDLPRATHTLYLITLPGLTGECVDLPRVTNTIYLLSLPGLTGECADLPRVTSALYILDLPGLTGACVDLPRVTSALQLSVLPGLTGACAALPTNTGDRRVLKCPLVTGALPVVSTNTPIHFYGNSSVTPEEYDQTIQNVVDAGGTGAKTLYISSRRTSASDANVATLISRGWTVNDSNV